MSTIPVSGEPIRDDFACDLNRSQVGKFNLVIVPYFFDPETAKRLHLDYIYVGYRSKNPPIECQIKADQLVKENENVRQKNC